MRSKGVGGGGDGKEYGKEISVFNGGLEWGLGKLGSEAGMG